MIDGGVVSGEVGAGVGVGSGLGAGAGVGCGCGLGDGAGTGAGVGDGWGAGLGAGAEDGAQLHHKRGISIATITRTHILISLVIMSFALLVNYTKPIEAEINISAYVNNINSTNLGFQVFQRAMVPFLLYGFTSGL